MYDFTNIRAVKSIYAKTHNLDLQKLLSDGPYKETYRIDMIQWSEEERTKNPGIFCQAACESAPIKPIWIVSDIRRKTDLDWFRKTYGALVKTIRISADIKVRESRGYTYTKGVDDAPSECDLDSITQWDLKVSNNNSEECEDAIRKIIDPSFLEESMFSDKSLFLASDL